MMDNQRFFTAIFLLFCFVTSHCSLISQSEISTCQAGHSNEPTGKNGSSTCQQKMVVSMTLMSGQQNTESLQANIQSVHQNGESQASLLKKPFRIEVAKGEVISSYRVHYIGAANGRPREESRMYQWRGSCVDKWNARNPSRRPQRRKDGTLEWDSQGFCCSCKSRRETTYLVRPNAYCNDKSHPTWHGHIKLGQGRSQKYGSSIHYMNMNPQWYDVFDIDMPMMQYKILVSLMEYNGAIGRTEGGETVGNWTLVSTFELSPSKTVSRSPDGRVVARIEGDLLGSHGPRDFSAKKLLIPSRRVRQAKTGRSAAGTGGWMLIDDYLVDLSGKECNKVGTSYSAFRLQPMACQQKPGSCFSNQPLDFLKHDKELIKRGKTGKYLIHNFGQVHPSTHPDDHSFILRFIHNSLHNTFVVFDIDASDIQFVSNSVRGRIVDVTASDFTALEDTGQIVVEVENIGEITGDFLVTLAHCHDERVPSTKKRSMIPGQVTNVTFNFQAFVEATEEVRCVVELYDVKYNLLGTSNVDLTVNVSCFCYGECGCTCHDNGTITRFECPELPPVVIEKGSFIVRLLLMILRLIGAHGIVGFFGAILLTLGFVKLMFGGIFCCRKTKAQEHYDAQIEKGVDPKAAKLVKCTGECRGAKMAQARLKRKIERFKRLGKDPYRLDDWRNSSYVCNCNDELSDIRFMNIIRAVFFFYYCFFLPFIWVGRKLWWGVYRDTAKNKAAADKSALRSAKKKGKLEDLGMVDIGAELRNIVREDQKRRQKEQKDLAALAKKTEATKTATTSIEVGTTKGKDNTTKGKPKKAEKAEAKKAAVLKRGTTKQPSNEEMTLAAMANVEKSPACTGKPFVKGPNEESRTASTKHGKAKMNKEKTGQSELSDKMTPPVMAGEEKLDGDKDENTKTGKDAKKKKKKEKKEKKKEEKKEKKSDRKKSKKDADDGKNQLMDKKKARETMDKQHKLDSDRDDFKPSRKAAKERDWDYDDYDSRKRRDEKVRQDKGDKGQSRRSDGRSRERAPRATGRSSRGKPSVRTSSGPRSNRGRTPERRHPRDSDHSPEKRGEHSTHDMAERDKVVSPAHSNNDLSKSASHEKALSQHPSKASHSSSKSVISKRDSHESQTSAHGSAHAKSSHQMLGNELSANKQNDSNTSLHSSVSRASHTGSAHSADDAKHSLHSLNSTHGVLSSHSAHTSLHSSHKDSKSSIHSSVQSSGSMSKHSQSTSQHSRSTHSSMAHTSSDASKTSKSSEDSKSSSSSQHSSSSHHTSVHSSSSHSSHDATHTSSNEESSDGKSSQHSSSDSSSDDEESGQSDSSSAESSSSSDNEESDSSSSESKDSSSEESESESESSESEDSESDSSESSSEDSEDSTSSSPSHSSSSSSSQSSPSHSSHSSHSHSSHSPHSQPDSRTLSQSSFSSVSFTPPSVQSRHS